MKTFNENVSLSNFQTWSGATDTKNTIIENDKVDEFDFLIEDLYPDGLSETALNDLLWFESEWIYEMLGISEDEDTDEEDEEETEDEE